MEVIEKVVDNMIVPEADGTTHQSIIVIVSEDIGDGVNSCVLTKGSNSSMEHAIEGIFAKGDEIADVLKMAFIKSVISGRMDGVSVGFGVVAGAREKEDPKETTQENNNI